MRNKLVVRYKKHINSSNKDKLYSLVQRFHFEIAKVCIN